MFVGTSVMQNPPMLSFREKLKNSILFTNFFIIFEKMRMNENNMGGILILIILHYPSNHKHIFVLVDQAKNEYQFPRSFWILAHFM